MSNGILCRYCSSSYIVAIAAAAATSGLISPPLQAQNWSTRAETLRKSCARNAHKNFDASVQVENSENTTKQKKHTKEHSERRSSKFTLGLPPLLLHPQLLPLLSLPPLLTPLPMPNLRPWMPTAAAARGWFGHWGCIPSTAADHLISALRVSDRISAPGF